MLMFDCEKPGLLVSVRSPEEALAALTGGADVIDVKEPDRGSLGAADPGTITDIARAVNGRAPVTAAVGELVDWKQFEFVGPRSSQHDAVLLFKFGLSFCEEIADWPVRWSAAIQD